MIDVNKIDVSPARLEELNRIEDELLNRRRQLREQLDAVVSEHNKVESELAIANHIAYLREKGEIYKLQVYYRGKNRPCELVGPASKYGSICCTVYLTEQKRNQDVYISDISVLEYK